MNDRFHKRSPIQEIIAGLFLYTIPARYWLFCLLASHRGVIVLELRVAATVGHGGKAMGGIIGVHRRLRWGRPRA